MEKVQGETLNACRFVIELDKDDICFVIPNISTPDVTLICMNPSVCIERGVAFKYRPPPGVPGSSAYPVSQYTSAIPTLS